MAEAGDEFSLLDLPDEVIVQCLSSLDFPSIMNISVSCKRLNHVSKDDEVWKGVYFHVWPCTDAVASHPVVQQVLHCNSWYESACYRRRLYQHLTHMMSYPSFRQELDYGKYSTFARHIEAEALVAAILCIGVFGVPGVGDGCTWREHQRIALHYAATSFKLKTRVEDVLRELFVKTAAFDDKNGPGLSDFVRYTDWAREFNSSDIYGFLWNVGMLRNHCITYPTQYSMRGMNDRARRALYGLIDCTVKRPASFLCGGHHYAFSNHPIASDGPFIIDPKDPSRRTKPISGQYYTKYPWIVVYHKSMALYPDDYNAYTGEHDH